MIGDSRSCAAACGENESPCNEFVAGASTCGTLKSVCSLRVWRVRPLAGTIDKRPVAGTRPGTFPPGLSTGYGHSPLATVPSRAIPSVRNLPRDAKPVMREATVAVQVAVKGADIFDDFKDATGSAIGGVAALWKLPVEILLRMQWARAGQHTFPVRDWSVGGGWSGTVQVVFNTSGTIVEFPPEPTYGGLNSTITRSLTATFEFTNGVGHWQAKERSTWDGKGHCIYEPKNTSSTLEGSGPAWMEVGEEQPREQDIPEDDERGTVSISFAYDPVRTAVGITGPRLRGQMSGTHTHCDVNLRPVRTAVSGETSIDYFPLGTAYGKMPDPRGASELSGTFTSPVEDPDGIPGTITITWNLRPGVGCPTTGAQSRAP